MRSLWKGYLKLSLVTIPLRMYTATKSRTLRFNMLHKDCGTRVKQEIVCPTHGKITRDEVVKGYQYSRDAYVVVTDDDLRRARREADDVIEVIAFVDDREIDPVYYEDSHYFAPDGKPGREAFDIFTKVMAEKKKAALARAVMHEREHYLSLKPYNGAMIGFTLRYADEVQDIHALEGLEGSATKEIDPKAVEMASTLVENMKGTFKPQEIVDEYARTLTEIIQAKVEGKEISIAPPVTKGHVINLMAALEKSIGATAPAAKLPKRGAVSAGTREPSPLKRRQKA